METSVVLVQLLVSGQLPVHLLQLTSAAQQLMQSCNATLSVLTCLHVDSELLAGPAGLAR